MAAQDTYEFYTGFAPSMRAVRLNVRVTKVVTTREWIRDKVRFG
jgi:hypothetical protein